MSATPTPQTSPNHTSEDESNHASEALSLSERLAEMIPNASGAWATSLLVHTVIIVVLALITLTQIEPETLSLTLQEGPEDEAMMEDPFELDQEFEELEDLEVQDPMEFEEIVETNIDQIMDASMSEAINVDSMLVASEMGTFESAGDLADFSGVGQMESEMSMSRSTFFKTGNKAKRIVYVVDNSNSMNNGRMETALVELEKSVHSLEPDQQFYIVFYSDTAYGLFHPKTVRNFVKATPKNKRLVSYWLGTVECCLKTNGTDAFKVARALQPDLIYLLGDGAFTDGAHQYITKQPIRGARLHALGMQLQKKNAARFESIAKAHNGTYRDVGITKEGKQLMQKFGARPRNNRRGPIWGLALPANKKNQNQKQKLGNGAKMLVNLKK